MQYPCKCILKKSYLKLSSQERTNTTWFDLYEAPRTVKFTETESRRAAARGWGGEDW